MPGTADQRSSTGDPRQSLQERYGTFQVYQEQFAAYVGSLLSQGYLLEEDVPRLMQLAEGNRDLFPR